MVFYSNHYYDPMFHLNNVTIFELVPLLRNIPAVLRLVKPHFHKVAKPNMFFL